MPGTATSFDAGCTGTVSAVGDHSSSVALESGGSRRVELFLAAANARLSSTLVDEYPIDVSSDGIRDAKWVYPRPSTREVFVEAKPDRGMGCANATCGIAMVDATVTNPHPTRHQTVRLSFSRKFNIRNSALFDAEARVPGITGLSAALWETAAGQPSGIPLQLSKNWHGGNKDIDEWADYNGRWWTASSLLRLPPNSKIDLTLAVNYELYGGVPAWSHAQLSVAGKGGFWLWEQAALGTGGENMCFDPLGTATRAFITDVRPSSLTESGRKTSAAATSGRCSSPPTASGEYLKEMNPQIHSSGPCLSKAEYSAATLDGSITSRLTVSGGRTDDLVRVFVDIHLEVVRDVSFSRLVFFQQSSETYSYHATHERFVWGGAGSATTSKSRPAIRARDRASSSADRRCTASRACRSARR